VGLAFALLAPAFDLLPASIGMGHLLRKRAEAAISIDQVALRAGA
jgi:hypothetical protein